MAKKGKPPIGSAQSEAARHRQVRALTHSCWIQPVDTARSAETDHPRVDPHRSGSRAVLILGKRPHEVVDLRRRRPHEALTIQLQEQNRRVPGQPLLPSVYA